jgi:hypothetical protein
MRAAHKPAVGAVVAGQHSITTLKEINKVPVGVFQ